MQIQSYATRIATVLLSCHENSCKHEPAGTYLHLEDSGRHATVYGHEDEPALCVVQDVGAGVQTHLDARVDLGRFGVAHLLCHAGTGWNGIREGRCYY